jgi:hypothetical protein
MQLPVYYRITGGGVGSLTLRPSALDGAQEHLQSLILLDRSRSPEHNAAAVLAKLRERKQRSSDNETTTNIPSADGTPHPPLDTINN